MKEIYNDLNRYLNEMCNYLEEEIPFFVNNIYSVCRINDMFLEYINDYSLDNKTVKNHLTYEEVYMLAREIIETIDTDYLQDYDKLLTSGQLDFSYNKKYFDSHFSRIEKKDDAQRIININREFNYNDVSVLIHEFIHYTNGKETSKNRYNLTEFLSIYFELYANNYLLKKGVNKNELDYLDRMKSLKHYANDLFSYEIVLLAFLKFGNLSENTVSLLQEYILNIKPEVFENECRILHKKLSKIEEKHKEELQKHPNLLACILSEEAIINDYKYILGTFLAIYAQKYGNLDAIVYLNNHINEMDNKSISDICLSIGINLKDKKFPQKLLKAFEEELQDKKVHHKNKNKLYQ